MLPPDELTITLKIVQEPDRGRMSGFSNPKDTRIIGPHLIVQALFAEGKKPSRIIADKAMSLVCKVVLVELQDPTDTSFQVSSANNLLGTTVTGCDILQDFNGEAGMFFIFPDLGVRAPGFYRIQCFLMDIDITKSCIPIQATCLTAPFEVHSPKTFPGTQGLTQISKWFSEQGVHFNISRRIKYT